MSIAEIDILKCIHCGDYVLGVLKEETGAVMKFTAHACTDGYNLVATAVVDENGRKALLVHLKLTKSDV